jgi:hypothetical protein
VSWPATISWKIGAVAGADERTHQIVTGIHLLARRERLEHRHHRIGSLLGAGEFLGRRIRRQHRREARTEGRSVGFGHAQQLADHRERERERERSDEIDACVRSGGRDRIEQLVDDGLHARAELLDPAGREGRRHQSPQATVIGRIDAEHVPRERRTGQALGHDTLARCKCGVHVLRQARLVERNPRLLVSDDQVGVVAVGKRDGMDRSELADGGEHREGVVAVVRAPCAQCVGRCHRASSAEG